MRRDCKLYTSPATLPTVKTICSLLQSNPTFVLYYNQTSFCYFIRRLCVFWYSNPLHVCWFLSVCVVKGGSYLLRLTEKQNLCIVPMFLYHHKFLGGKLLVWGLSKQGKTTKRWRVFPKKVWAHLQRKTGHVKCQGHSFQLQARVEYFLRWFFLYFAWAYRNHSRVIKSNQITVSVPHFFSQSTKLILLEVIVPCLMFMMSWLVLFSGVLSWRACSPAVVKLLRSD